MEELNEMADKMKMLAEETKENRKELDRQNYYRNVNSIKKNVQFFFWFTILCILFGLFYINNAQLFA